MKFLLVFIITIKLARLTCAAEVTNRELCPCVPLNTCADAHRYNQNDAKYFATVLKCSDIGHVRCCEVDGGEIYRRGDDDVNELIITDEEAKKEAKNDEDLEEETTEELILDTTEAILFNIELKLPAAERNSKFIDDHVDVVYPNLVKTLPREQKKDEPLFLIYPDNNLETHEEENTEVIPETTTQKSLRRVVVKKRLRKTQENEEILEASESEISPSIVKPPSSAVFPKRATRPTSKFNRKSANNGLTTSTETTVIIDDVTTKRRRKKIKKFRKASTTTEATTEAAKTTTTKTEEPSSTITAKLQRSRTTTKPRRKIIYDPSSRVNYLKKPLHIRLEDGTNNDDDEREEAEVTTLSSLTSSSSAAPTLTPEKTTSTTTQAPLVIKLKNLIDKEHKAMIETVHKTLTAIHSGADMKVVKSAIASHHDKLKEIRKTTVRPTPRSSTTFPQKPRNFERPTSRGNVRYNPTVATISLNQLEVTTASRVRTRSSSTTARPSQFRARTTKLPEIDVLKHNSLVEDAEINTPKDFHPSQLIAISMGETEERIFVPVESENDGFYPIIGNDAGRQ